MFEPPQRNSGILGGKFLERGRIKKPDGVNYFVAPVSKVFSLFLFLEKGIQMGRFFKIGSGGLIGPWNP